MGKCYYCQRQRATMRDHIVPRQHGGPDDYWNLVPVCAECNGMLSYYLPARDGDTVPIIRGKKKRALGYWRKALKRNPAWRRLPRKEKWRQVCLGAWPPFLPRRLEEKYEEGRQTRGRLISTGGRMLWRSARPRRSQEKVK